MGNSYPWNGDLPSTLLLVASQNGTLWGLFRPRGYEYGCVGRESRARAAALAITLQLSAPSLYRGTSLTRNFHLGPYGVLMVLAISYDRETPVRQDSDLWICHLRAQGFSQLEGYLAHEKPPTSLGPP